MKTNPRKFLKVSLLLIALAMSLAILSACNTTYNTLASQYFEGNCVTKGYTRYYKANGTYFDRVDLEYGPHTYDDGTVIAPTCTTDGERKFICEVCGHEHIVPIEKLGHNYIRINHLAATCIEEGRDDFVCGRCYDEHSEVLAKIDHDFEEIIIKEPTCTEKGSKKLVCRYCNLTETVEIDFSHNYEETIIIQATCTEKGLKRLVCQTCSDTQVEEIDMLPHTLAREEFDGEAHWSVCAVCGNTYDYAEHSNDITEFAATCVDYAYTHIQCRNCNYYRDIIDDNSLLPHSYEAYTCLTCQRDRMLDYKAEFDSKGANASNLIDIKSEEMLVCFYDYLIAYEITEPKYIKTSSYTTVSSDQDSVSAFLTSVRRKTTATNWSVKTMYVSKGNEVAYFYMNAYNADNFVFDEAASYTPDQYPEQYKNLNCIQYTSYQFENNTPRPAFFDDFAYKTRRNEMSVSSSDQLFFAFEHGYKPVAIYNTPAYTMLNKAKTVARRIMNDGMTELEKIRAIYSYLVSDIGYDYAIVELTSGADSAIHYAKCSSYYLEGVFDYGLAVCDGISKAFCVLAGLEDIKCVRVTSENHAWNKVYIDVNGDGQKAWFGTDATWGNKAIIYNGQKREYMSVEDFLFTDTQKVNKGQIGRNYVDTNSDAATEENPFAYFYFNKAENATCDYVITSNVELYALIDYLKTNITGYIRAEIVTVNIFIVTTYWTIENITNNLYRELHNKWIMAGTNTAISVGKNEITYGEVTGYSVSLLIPNL